MRKWRWISVLWRTQAGLYQPFGRRSAAHGMKLAAVRRYAMSLPEATEEPHFESTSFRVRGRIFATSPPGGAFLHVFVAGTELDAALVLYPQFADKLFWGKKLAGIRIALDKAAPAAVHQLLRQAWRRRAPKKLHAVLQD